MGTVCSWGSLAGAWVSAECAWRDPTLKLVGGLMLDFAALPGPGGQAGGGGKREQSRCGYFQERCHMPGQASLWKRTKEAGSVP